MHRLRLWDASQAAIVHGILLNGYSDVRQITQRGGAEAVPRFSYLRASNKFHFVKICLNVKTCPLFVPP